jgi:cathepsin B
LALAEAGGSLKLAWNDCGGGSTPGTVKSLSPDVVVLGSKTTVTGSGTCSEDVPGGTFEIALKASIISQTYTGDLCSPKSFSLPLGTGTIAWDGVKCPIAAGTVDIPVDITLSASLPGPLQSVGLKISGADTSKKDLLCMQINTSPATSGDDVHPERKAMIEEIENTPGVLWKAAPHPRFASEAPGASRNLCGVNGDQKTMVKELLQQGEIVEAPFEAKMEIPDSFDSAENWPQCAKIINDIRDQSNCGCCWAFGGAEAGSDRMCISTNASMMIPLSAQDACFNGGGFMSMGCNGGQISSPWSYMKSKGLVSGGQYQGSGPFGKGMCSDFSMPHCHHHGPQGSDPYPAEGAPGCPSQKSASKFSKCDADATAPHNDFASDKYSYSGNTVTARGVSAIQQAVMAGGPMEVAFTVYADFENYASGIYHHVSGGQVGGHAVKVVGWGVEGGVNYWKIANSWNPYWGEKGYFRIKFGEGGIDDQAIGSDPAAKWSKAGDVTESVLV